jgi:hypothetical protein
MLLFMQNYLNTCHCCRSVLKLYIKDRRDSDHIAVVYTHKCRLCVVSYFKGMRYSHS